MTDSTPTNFTSKVVPIEAIQFNDKDSAMAIMVWCPTSYYTPIGDSGRVSIPITSSIISNAGVGDWIAKKADGTFMVVTHDDILENYDVVTGNGS